MERQRRMVDWTWSSVLQAAGLATAGMMIALQLTQWHLWPDIEWSFLFVPAALGSAFLALKHPGTSLLATFLFFPLLMFFMFLAGACLPLGP
jgi:hypothetical protein